MKRSGKNGELRSRLNKLRVKRKKDYKEGTKAKKKRKKERGKTKRKRGGVISLQGRGERMNYWEIDLVGSFFFTWRRI